MGSDRAREREREMGDGRWEMGDGRWEMGDVTLKTFHFVQGLPKHLYDLSSIFQNDICLNSFSKKCKY
jgi:hypothetical protein